MNATVVGGGLAGCEAAWALAQRGVEVTLVEMRPRRTTPAHQSEHLAEIVCSNTFKSLELTNAHGLLKAELRVLGSLLMDVAETARIPGGAALTVDREAFSREATQRVASHPNIEVVRQEATTLPSPGIVATGPLTSDALAAVIQDRLGVESLAFYDAIAPILDGDTVDKRAVYRLSRYGKGGGDDFLNIPLDHAAYESLVDALVSAEQHAAHDFDPIPLFEGCLPVEEMARRGRDTLRFGPLKPVGLPDPRTGTEPHAVVQLRREDRAGQMWNMVGFQTRLTIGAQRAIVRRLPGLAGAEFHRYGSVHRNTYLNTPAALTPSLALPDDPGTMFAGQLVGVEGYTESLGTGLWTGINLARTLRGRRPVRPPAETMLGALLRYVHECDPSRFQPMNANFGLLPPLESRVRDKRRKRELLSERALAAMRRYADEVANIPV